MVRINLLPPEVMAARKKKAAQFRIVKILLVVAVLFAAGFNFLFAMTLRVRNEVAQVEQQRSQIEEQIEVYRPYQEMQSANNERIALLKEAMGMQPGWREIVAVIGQQIPPNAWLTNFSMSKSEEEVILNFRGLTYDHPSTARWLESLEEVPGMQDVFCQYSAEETVDERDLVRFEVQAVVLAGQEYDPLGRGDGND